MLTLRPSNERGHADHGWLDTYHTFSFNTYHDENHMGYRDLRVINEDFVAPGKGFGTHPHRDMEIITYVVEGALEHKDSMGTKGVIRRGDVQRMSAGKGVLHSEFNHSSDERLHLLQIWILPSKKGIQPSYEQKRFDDDAKQGRLLLVASADGRDDSLQINQDVNLYASLLDAGKSVDLSLSSGRHAWVQVVGGSMTVNGQSVSAGDGLAIAEENRLDIRSEDSSEFLVFDLA